MTQLYTLESQLQKCLLSLRSLEDRKSLKHNMLVPNFKEFLHCFSECLTLINRYATQLKNRPVLVKVKLCLNQVVITICLFSGHPLVRQTIHYLMERLHWCLKELQCLLCRGGADGGVKDDANDESSGGAERSLAQRTDTALQVVLAEAANSAAWRPLVEDVIGQAVALAKVAGEVDYKEITAACQKVLEESRQLSRGKLPANQMSLMSEALAASLSTLEHRVNVAVLRIFMQVFSEPSRPLKRLVCLCKSASGLADFDPLISELDAHMERIVLVGQFAISCSENASRSFSIQNHLASVESVDNYLAVAVRAMYLQPASASARDFAHFLCDHWLDQLNLLHIQLDHVVDSYALTTVVRDSMTETADQLERKWSDRLVETAFNQGWLLYKHLTNSGNTDVDTPTRLQLKRAISELEAAARSGIGHPAVLKRLKLLTAKIDEASGQLSQALSQTSPERSSPSYSGQQSFKGSIRDLPLDITFSSISRSQSHYKQPEWLRKKIMDAKRYLKPPDYHPSQAKKAQENLDRTPLTTPKNNKTDSKHLVTPYLKLATPRSTTLYVRTPRKVAEAFVRDTGTESYTNCDSLARDIVDILDNSSALHDTLSSMIADHSHSENHGNHGPLETFTTAAPTISSIAEISNLDTPERLMEDILDNMSQYDYHLSDSSSSVADRTVSRDKNPIETFVANASNNRSSTSEISVPTSVSGVDTPDRLMDIKHLEARINELKLIKNICSE